MFRILEILVEGVILYLLYKFVVNFVIPVYRNISRARKQMKEMQNRMNEQMQNRRPPHSQNTPYRPEHTTSKSTKKEDEGEYIDYEEVK